MVPTSSHAILAPLFLAFTVFGVIEQRDCNADPVPPVSFKKIFTTITGARGQPRDTAGVPLSPHCLD